MHRPTMLFSILLAMSIVGPTYAEAGPSESGAAVDTSRSTSGSLKDLKRVLKSRYEGHDVYVAVSGLSAMTRG